MRWIALTVVALTLGSQPVLAQTTLDHSVQKTWDNLFSPGPAGDPRTNWERRHDDQRYAWCREHPGYAQCRPSR